jgi:hypothetical protein
LKNSLIKKLHQKHTFTQFLAGCLFGIFILNSIFCFLFFEVKRKTIRHEVKHEILSKLSDSQLFAFSFNDNFDKEEFEYNGVMYDVVRQKIVNDKTLILCFQDKKETDLNRSIEASMKNGLANTPIKKTQQILIKLIKTSFISFDNYSFYFHPQSIFIPNIRFVEAIFVAFNRVISPPPDKY